MFLGMYFINRKLYKIVQKVVVFLLCFAPIITDLAYKILTTKILNDHVMFVKSHVYRKKAERKSKTGGT